jgi:hypothetical protein
MTDTSTIIFAYGHHTATFPLAFNPQGYKLDVTRGPGTSHCGHNQADSKVEVSLKGSELVIRAHVLEEYLKVKVEVFGDFVPDSLPF